MKTKQALLPVAAITLLVVGGSVLGLATQQKAHAQTPTTQVQTSQPKTSASVSGNKEVSGQETPDATGGAAENENDGPGGHQDPQGANVNNQVDGAQ